VPACVAAGVPVSEPVAVLKIAQDGLFATLNASALPSASLALGVNAYALPVVTAVGGVPEMTGAVFTGAATGAAVTVTLNAGRELRRAPSETLMPMLEYVPACAAEGVPDSVPVLLLKVAHAGLFEIENVSVSRCASVAVGVKL